MKTTSAISLPATGRGYWLLPVVVFGYLWCVLINNLRVEWALNPQYSYGWAVPFLCAYLIIKSRRQKAESKRSVSSFQHFSFQFLFVVCALLYAPVRLVQAANPVWALVSWGLAFSVIGITLCALRLAIASPLWSDTPRPSDGRGWHNVTGEGRRTPDELFPLSLGLWNALGPRNAQHIPTGKPIPLGSISAFVFPLFFFLVAVPWPSVIEEPLIQALTRADARATVELVGWFGIPAVPHGNVIEVATGAVGIGDACSGIRSFQATLMISLFLGEFYSLCARRRALCVLAGFAFSLLFNLVRMSLLVWVASRRGVDAIAAWHDPAGVTILLACFFSLWGLGAWMKTGSTRVSRVASGAPPEAPSDLQSPISHLRPLSSLAREARSCFTGPATEPPADRPLNSDFCFPLSGFQISILALAAWIVLTDVGVEIWYRMHEAHLPPVQTWTISWPTNNPSFKDIPLGSDALQGLKCDQNRSAGWQEDGRQWQMIFLKWNPGTRVQLGHSPNICMTGAGHTLNTVSNCEWFDIGAVRLPFAVFEVMDAPEPFYVFYCMWNDRLNTPGAGATYLSLCGNRLAPVLSGLRNSGQRSLEIAVGGVGTASEAEAAVRAELQKILVVTTLSPPPARP